MLSIGILDWLDENGEGEYPLSKNIGLKGMIVDASFLQFDNFVPVLNSIKIFNSYIRFNIKFDVITLDINLYKAGFEPGSTFARIYYKNRYLGVLVFGYGVNTAFAEKVGEMFTINTKFVPTTVTSINRSAGLFSLDGLYGALTISTVVGADKNIYFGVSSNEITWNAVGIPEVPSPAITPLKTINSKPPNNNNVIIKESELIKITPGVNSLTFSLANSDLNDNIAPTKNYA